MLEQPPRTANFTRDGFKITKTPPLLLEALQSFFEITKYNYSREVRGRISGAGLHRQRDALIRQEVVVDVS